MPESCSFVGVLATLCKLDTGGAAHYLLAMTSEMKGRENDFCHLERSQL